MEQLLLVNPRKRRRSKRRTPPRGPGGRFMKRGTVRRRARRHSPRRRRNPVPSALSMANPRRRRRSVARVHRRRRRNPVGGGFLGNLTRPLMPALIGAGGAIATDAVFGKLPLPANLKTGNLAVVTKAVLAVALGMVVSRFGNRRIGEQMTAGALTVQAHSVLMPFVAQIPGLGYYGAGYALPASAGVGEYISEIPNNMADSQFYARDAMSEYISD